MAIIQSPRETERRNRIRLSVAAYAYEVFSESLMTDAEFDALAMKIEPSVSTGHAVLDRFFYGQFDPFTGIWVLHHPNQAGLRRICLQVYKLKA